MRLTEILPFAHDVEAPHADVPSNQRKLAAFLEGVGCDVFIASSQDAFLSEYNVPANNHRFQLSAFTGSVGDGVFVRPALLAALSLSEPFALFVDGRYHLQADEQTAGLPVTVVRLTLQQTIDASILDWLGAAAAKRPLTIGLDAMRTSYQRAQALGQLAAKHGCKVMLFRAGEVNKALDLKGWKTNRPVEPVARAATGRTLPGNLAILASRCPEGADPATQCLFSCASDDAAWLLSARGYHMPQSSSFLAYTFALGQRVLVYLPQESDGAPVRLAVDERVGNSVATLEVVKGGLDALQAALSKTPGVSDLRFDASAMNALLPEFLQGVWPAAKLDSGYKGFEFGKSHKTPEELSSIRQSFLRSSRAIAETLRWAKDAVRRKQGERTLDPKFKAPITELDLSTKIAKEYRAQGAVELSFNSIAAAGPHGAIIHYGAANDQSPLKRGQIALLDSGAYYEEGFATDCTRAVFCGGDGVLPEAWQREIYTVTLKSCMAGMRARFKAETMGKEIDAIARSVVRAKGYEYGHGTGHGIGVHVHEGGVRISAASQLGFFPSAVVSMEPGIYLEGKGGVRIENVVIVEEGAPGELRFDNVVFVGYDWDLIDLALLNDQEKQELREYERKCQSLGTQVTACPLL